MLPQAFKYLGCSMVMEEERLLCSWKESQLCLEKIQLEKIQEEDLLEDKKISPVKPSKLSKIKEKINKYTQKN